METESSENSDRDRRSPKATYPSEQAEAPPRGRQVIPACCGWQSIGNSWADTAGVGGREMTPLLTGLLWSQKMMMKPFYQGGLSEVAFLSGCQSVTCGHGLWNQLHVYMGCRTEKGFSLTPPFPKVEKPRPGSGQCAPGPSRTQRSPGYGECSTHQGSGSLGIR